MKRIIIMALMAFSECLTSVINGQVVSDTICFSPMKFYTKDSIELQRICIHDSTIIGSLTGGIYYLLTLSNDNERKIVNIQAQNIWLRSLGINIHRNDSNSVSLYDFLNSYILNYIRDGFFICDEKNKLPYLRQEIMIPFSINSENERKEFPHIYGTFFKTQHVIDTLYGFLIEKQ